MGQFVLKAPYTARGDQPQAIEALARGVMEGMPAQVLLGVTGSGKTFVSRSLCPAAIDHFLLEKGRKTVPSKFFSA